MRHCGFQIPDCGFESRAARRAATRSASTNPHSAIRISHFAFTLIELVLVLAVLALLMAAAAPTLRGWSKGGKVREATDQVLTATRYAQSQAIHEAVTYRIAVNPFDGALELWRLDGETAAPAAGEFHDPVALPDGFRIRIQRVDGAMNQAVEFYPDGRVTPGRIEISTPWDEVTLIESRWPAQSFRLVAEGGAQ